MCTYRSDKSYKHDHYQLVSSSAGQRRDRMEIHPPPHQGACPTRRDMVHVAMATSLCGLFLSPQSLWVNQYLHWDCGNSLHYLKTQCWDNYRVHWVSRHFGKKFRETDSWVPLSLFCARRAMVHLTLFTWARCTLTLLQVATHTVFYKSTK